MNVQFGIGQYEHVSRKVGYQRSVNCYLEQEPQGTANPIALLGSYGVKSLGTVGSGRMRGALVVNGRLFVVVGFGLYSVASDGSSNYLGAIPNEDRVGMAGDGTHVMVVTNRDGYVWDSVSVTKITDPDFPGADWVQYFDTYFVIGIGGKLYISANLDPTSWSALDFASAEASPDDIVGGLVEKRELFLGGRDSFEVWYNSGESDFPLARTGSGTAEFGLLAKDSLQKYDNRLFFVATNFTVCYIDGYTPLIISKPDISKKIESLSETEQAGLYGLTWTESGHLMYAITSPYWTLVYDTRTQEWHSRKSEDYPNWRAAFVVNAYGKMIVGDREANRIGYLSNSTFTEWGDEMTMTAMAQVRHQGNNRITAANLELVFDGGVGTSGQGANPVVGVRQSFDGGYTWGAQRLRPMGKTGKHETRAKWSQMGQARHRLIEYEIADPVRRSLLYSTIDEEMGWA